MPRFSPTLLDHARNPRNGGPMRLPDAMAMADLAGQAPRVTIYLRVDRGTIQEATFTAFGCGCTIAACSILTELVRGLPLNKSSELTPESLVEALDGMPSDKRFCAEIVIEAFQAATESLQPRE